MDCARRSRGWSVSRQDLSAKGVRDQTVDQVYGKVSVIEESVIVMGSMHNPGDLNCIMLVSHMLWMT